MNPPELEVHKENKSSSEGESNPCPICLGFVNQDSYLHKYKFCYNCIVHWINVVISKHSRKLSSVKCPLCKTENFSIIHGYDGCSFQQHYINQDIGDSFILSRAHKYRLQSYYTESGALNGVFDVLRYWKFFKYLQPNRWLQSWLIREIQALIQEEDVNIIVHHILGVIDSFLRRNGKKGQTNTPETKQVEFKTLVSDAARVFLTARTDRFVNEMELFLAAGLNIDAYDEVYMEQLGWNTPAGSSNLTKQDPNEHIPVVPYLHIFDEDSDGKDDF